MKKCTNKHGKESYSEVDTDDLFDKNLFHEVDMSWSDTDTQKAFHSNLGSLTILNRMTGYSFGIRDTETGYRNVNGEFWLASCNCDVLESGVKTIGEAIEWVKERANTCVPNRDKSRM